MANTNLLQQAEAQAEPGAEVDEGGQVAVVEVEEAPSTGIRIGRCLAA